MVTSWVEFAQDILHLEEQPRQRLVNAEPKRSPSPLHLGCAQTTEIGVVEEILIVVPRHEAVVQGGNEGVDDDQGQWNRNQPGAPVPGRRAAPDLARHSDSEPEPRPPALTFLAQTSSI